ncbi:Mitochodrial transcription termination factor-related protein [Corchorus olitorius]|uniref:Mitochodrial transcription termination factor-related protein n=1 Tax=Corchorus olitorius TaxID=93759 RepID=A0A1R3IX16_9ROSI|nr:Mitochodrial transcription termination factor-related protein [Corchorus olitorius]
MRLIWMAIFDEYVTGMENENLHGEMVTTNGEIGVKVANNENEKEQISTSIKSLGPINVGQSDNGLAKDKCTLGIYEALSESALSVSKKVQLKNPTKPDSVLNFFKNHGFSQTQIRKTVERMPKLLLCNAEKTLLPKFQFFYSKGIPSSDLSVVLSSTPAVLGYNIDNCIIPNFNSFKDFTRCDDSEVFLAYKKCSLILSNSFQSIVAANVALLREHGVPDSNILTELVRHPRVFTLNHDKFRRTVEEVEKLGFNPLKSNFLTAYQVLAQISKSTWERKLNVFKEWGWSDEDFVIAFEKFPRQEDNSKVFSASSSVIQRFYQETNKWSVSDLE